VKVFAPSYVVVPIDQKFIVLILNLLWLYLGNGLDV